MGKKLGQHFLYDDGILSDIVSASGITHEDVVVEIGPGTGSLTKKLLGTAGRVIAIELDRRLYDRLCEQFPSRSDFNLVHADAMKFDFSSITRFKATGNIPYYITTPLIFRLIEERPRLRSIAFTMQKEVAERIASPPGNKSYGALSVVIQYIASPSVKFIISKNAFRPPPAVDSAFIVIDMLKTPAAVVANEKIFYKTVKTAFSQRRKTILNSLKTLFPSVRDVLSELKINEMARAETLSVHEFAAIANSFYNNLKLSDS
ncbi:16S rRNA (adenine(1518)-N(6)/adenine(1519)-N(6))-dimethyltransferase RsmA [Candidatus Magnetomonas plexicatena]|uniref:16S rRNA (adenine(1518)-N(6)/adenine(1519)-N(6))- dimethyltransferase RsmA n=1 Tax=Candidatus Magnetomonas plexicatena TaxID=2552947 RepID=UPI001C790332|nr:ribosomal RNA small subunit methyltransferase A [Nitrospirales bacterium LBB_01]